MTRVAVAALNSASRAGLNFNGRDVLQVGPSVGTSIESVDAEEVGRRVQLRLHTTLSRPDRPRPRPPVCDSLWIRCPHQIRSWYFSSHAATQVDMRGFDPHSVADACEAPDEREPSRRHGSALWLYKRGHITAVLNLTSHTIVTVLLRSETEWDDDDVRKINGVAA